MNKLKWPPAYRVRISKKARRLQLQISPAQGLEVVVPRRYTHANVEKFLNSQRTWLEHQWQLMQLPAVHTQAITLPNEIYFAAIDERWTIHYISTVHHKSYKLIANQNHALTIFGKTSDTAQCFKLIRQWIKRKAYHHFSKMLQSLSIETDLTYTKLTIRLQKTRWGSCSRKQIINLNATLLFLPFKLVRYILIHELCHTRYHNHSRHFWSCVAKYDVNYQRHIAALQKAEAQLPPWLSMR